MIGAVLSLLVSFFVIRGFRFEFGAEVLVPRNTESFTWLLLFVLFARFFYLNFKNNNHRLKIYAAVFGLIIGLFQVIGGCLEHMESVSRVWNDGKVAVNLTNMLFSYACVYYSFAFLAFRLLEQHSQENPRRAAGRMRMKSVLLIWLALILCYVPWYLYFYPGILTYDSGAQVLEAVTPGYLSDHNPAFVTLLIRAVILPVMKAGGSVQLGIGICTLLQMLIVTFVFSLSYIRICQYISNGFLRILFFVWFAFYPVHAIYSITMWKDILFSVCLLAFTLCLDLCTEDEDAFFTGRKYCVFLFLCLLLLPLLRHNGIAVSVGMSLVFLFRFKRFRVKTALICGAALLCFAGWKLILLPALHTEKGPSYELLNVPIQQISRVFFNHHRDLPPSLTAEAEAYFEPEFWEAYQENIADPVKAKFNNHLFDSAPDRFWSLWRELGQLYPGEFLDGFLMNNYGYWYPETSWWITGIGVLINVPLEGVHQAPILRPVFMDKIYKWYYDREYNKTPVLPLFFKPGACFWVWLFCGFYCLYNNRRKFVLFLPCFLIWLTLQFSAVYCEFRYVYGLFTCLPLFLAAALSPVRKE